MEWSELVELLTAYYGIRLLVVIILTVTGLFLLRHLLQKVLQRIHGHDPKKEKTIASVLKSISNYLALCIILFFAIDPWIDVTTLLAGAGVVGVILGFGAQNIIKDVFAGFFLVYEKQVQEGDFVAINGTYTGTVEEVGIRMLRVREWSGKVLHIANSEIKELQNYNVEKMRVIERVTLSFREDPDHVLSVLEGVCDVLNDTLGDYLLRQEDGEAIEAFGVYGMTKLNHEFSGYEYAVTGMVREDVYWQAAKTVRLEIARELFHSNMKMPEKNVRYQARMNVERT